MYATVVHVIDHNIGVVGSLLVVCMEMYLELQKMQAIAYNPHVKMFQTYLSSFSCNACTYCAHWGTLYSLEALHEFLRGLNLLSMYLWERHFRVS